MSKNLLVVAALSFVLAGCASVQLGDPAKNAELKNFAPKADVASIYIYRNENMGGAVPMDVAVDGKPLGTTGAKTYLYTEVTPGTHVITSKAENTSELSIDTSAGKVYYVWEEVKMGLMYARNKLSLVDETTGQNGVKESNLAATK